MQFLQEHMQKELDKKKDKCYIAALQKKVNNIEKSFIEVLKLEQRKDYQIYKDFQYKTWDSLSPLVSRYLMERYGFTLVKDCLKNLDKNVIKSSECIGSSFDRYKLKVIGEVDQLKIRLADFTAEQLSSILDTVIDEMDKRKIRKE